MLNESSSLSSYICPQWFDFKPYYPSSKSVGNTAHWLRVKLEHPSSLIHAFFWGGGSCMNGFSSTLRTASFNHKSNSNQFNVHLSRCSSGFLPIPISRSVGFALTKKFLSTLNHLSHETIPEQFI